MQKYLNPRNDVAFKRIFGTEKNSNILITLLNEVLKNQYLNSEKNDPNARYENKQ